MRVEAFVNLILASCKIELNVGVLRQQAAAGEGGCSYSLVTSHSLVGITPFYDLLDA